MQAIILSGGFGTRLRPLTYSRPKPLMPLYDTTLIGYLINKMPASVDRVILASNYKIEMIEEYINERDWGREVLVVDEPEPLGTGGAMKNAQRYIDDTFVAFNGDLITSIDVQKFIDFHKHKGGIGTISLWEVEDPTAFGVIGVDDSEKIYRFKEKPKPEEVFSNLINAGSYVLEPGIFDFIEEGKKVSIEREVFPFVLDKGLYGYKFAGHWIDSGTQPLYLGAQRIILEEKGEEVYIGKDVDLGEGALVGDYSVVYDNVNIGAGTLVKGSMVFSGTTVGSGTVIEGAIVGENSIIGDECIIPLGCIIGDGVTLEPGTRLAQNSRVPAVEE